MPKGPFYHHFGSKKDFAAVALEKFVARGKHARLAIQLRDAGDVYNISFKDITLEARYFSDP